MKYKYFYFITLAFCITFSSCFMMQNTITLTVENKANDAKIIIIDYKNIYNSYNIQNNEKKYFGSNMLKNIKYIYIKSETIEGIFDIRSRNNFFPQRYDNHILIRNNDFVWNGQTEGITASYVKYSNINNEIIDFETVKRENFKEIYDIIKN